MKLVARTVRQGDTEFYETAILAEELMDEELFEPDRWTAEGGSGYQREINQRHARNIARYLSGEEGTNVLPTNVVVNVRGPINKRNLGNGMVEIDFKDKAVIIDGQHRAEALRLANESNVELDKYEMPVTITNFDLKGEIMHFRKINTAANRAPKGLDQQLSSRLANEFNSPHTLEQENTSRAVEVVTRLATDMESPWHGLIALGGTRKRNFHVAVQSAVVQAIDKMFTNGRFADGSEDRDEVYRIFKEYWEVLQEFFPQAFETPQHHNIQRRAGFWTWHLILQRVFNYNLHPTKEQYRALIKSLVDKTGIDSTFWDYSTGRAKGVTQNYGSVRAFQVLADELWSSMDKDVLRQRQEA